MNPGANNVAPPELRYEPSVTPVHSSTLGFHVTPMLHPQTLPRAPLMYASTLNVPPIGLLADGHWMAAFVVDPCWYRLIVVDGAETVSDPLLHDTGMCGEPTSLVAIKYPPL